MTHAEVVPTMIAAPWYLFAAGIVLVIFGLLLGAVFGGGRSSRNMIDSRMSDAEIARRLERQSSVGLPGIIFYLGMLCVFVSVCWRLVRLFV